VFFLLYAILELNQSVNGVVLSILGTWYGLQPHKAVLLIFGDCCELSLTCFKLVLACRVLFARLSHAYQPFSPEKGRIFFRMFGFGSTFLAVMIVSTLNVVHALHTLYV